jgi:4-amino-4-deoxy-L-arabinose transferase-like glycosyltransferase
VDIARYRTLCRHREWPLLAGLALYAVSYVVFYPATFAILDEDAYVTQAYLFRAGRISYDNAQVSAPRFSVNMSGRTVGKYPPGNALFLVPFTWLGWRALFLSGLILAMLGTLVFRQILRELSPDTDPIWSMLYLMYPTVVLFSRTVMSDLPAATAVLVAAWLTLRQGRSTVTGGLVLGFACLIRYSNAIFIPVLLAMLISRTGKRGRTALVWTLGLAPGLVCVLLYNAYAFGGPFRFPMYLTGHFAPWFFWRNLGYYAVNLLLLYPLMLVAPLAAGPRRILLLGLPAWTLLLLYCFFSYIYDTPSLPLRLAVGTRYLLPAIPFFTLGYAIVLGRLEARFRQGAALKYLVLAALLTVSVIIQCRHQGVLRTQDRYRRMLYDAVPENALLLCNADASELVSHAWGPRRVREYITFNAPVPLQREISDTDTVYAAMLRRPGRNYQVDRTLFETLVRRSGPARLVVETEDPLWFRVYCLKPSAR